MNKQIDIDTALVQLGGSEKLYKTLLLGFNERYSHVDKDIWRMITNNEMEEARRLVHSMKGLSGNLGATTLREYAIRLEIALKDSYGNYEQLYLDFSKTLASVLDEIRELLHERYQEEVIDPSAGLSEKEQRFISDCKTLLEALNSYKYGDVRRAARELQEQVAPVGYETKLNQILQFINQYEYDSAITAIREFT